MNHLIISLCQTFLQERKKDGKHRVILNLNELNDAVVYEKFKIETLESIIKLVRKDCYMSSLDLTNAYYTIPVAPEYQAYLWIPWRGKLYQYTCYPNGLAEAPRKFTKIMKPPLAFSGLKVPSMQFTLTTLIYRG